MRSPPVFQSNRLESLYEKLRDRLFAKGGDPFGKRLVVVPTRAIEEWLKRRFASDVGIFFGVDILFLEEILTHSPSKEELFLQIDRRLQNPRKSARLVNIFRDYRIYAEEVEDPLWKELGMEFAAPKEKGALHFFAFSYIPPKIFNFFKTESFYHLSPTEAYLGDVKSDRETNRLVRFFRKKGIDGKEIDQLEELLKERHPLLANWGGLHRRMCHLFEDLPSEEVYVRENALQIQKEMLDLDEPSGFDPSIEIHAAPNRWREIEVLYQELLKLKVDPSDVVVMAPDIATYLPYIRAVFEEIPYRVEEVRSHDGLELLLKLAVGRWEVSSVLALLTYPPFSRKWGLGDREIGQIRQWIGEVGIHWGRDSDHREEVLGKPMGGGWKEGLQMLVDRLATDLSTSSGELLEKLLTIFESLSTDLNFQEKSLADWASHLESMMETYFDGEEVTVVDRLKRLSVDGEFGLPPIAHLLEGWKERMSINGGQLNTVRFCSLLPNRAVPSKVIALIGMEEGSFPRHRPKDPLDELETANRPRHLELDKALFLEVVLSVRQHLLITYPSVDGQDGLRAGPSSLVTQLKEAYAVEEISHPHTSHHHSYFGREPGSFSQKAYKRAKALYGEQKDPPPFFGDFAFEVTDPPSVVQIADFLRVLRNPLDLYFRHCLGFLPPKEVELLDDEKLIPTPLDLHRMVWDARETSIDAVMEGYPVDPFRALVRERLEEKVSKLDETFEKQGVDRLFSAHLLEACEEIERKGDQVFLPPLQVDGIQLVGEIPRISSAGLLCHGRGDLTSVLKSWPLFLIFSAIANKIGVGKDLLFAGAPKQLSPFFDNPLPHLKRCLDLYFLSCEHPNPITAEWAGELLKGKLLEGELAMKWKEPLVRTVGPVLESWFT